MTNPTNVVGEIVCPECGGKVSVVKGWESDKALQCVKCGEYCYFVGNIACIKTAHFDNDKGWDIKSAQTILAERKL